MKVGLLIYDKDHWTDKAGYTARNLPPGWTAEKFARRYRRGDIIEVLREEKIPPPGEPVRDGVKILVFEGDYAAVAAKYGGPEVGALLDPEDPSGAPVLSHSRYTIDTTLMAKGRADTTEAVITAAETDKTKVART